MNANDNLADSIETKDVFFNGPAQNIQVSIQRKTNWVKEMQIYIIHFLVFIVTIPSSDLNKSNNQFFYISISLNHSS